jgi:hypothetical protein
VLPVSSDSPSRVTHVGADPTTSSDAGFRAEPGRQRAYLRRDVAAPPLSATPHAARPGIPRASAIASPPVQPGMAASTAIAASAEARRLDFIVPHEMRMGRQPFTDVAGVQRHPSGRISETETVWMALQVLNAAAHAPVPPEGDKPVSAYLDIRVEQVSNAIFPCSSQYPYFGARDEARRTEALESELSILDRSPTFRQMLRLAIQEGRLGLARDQRWTVRIVPPMGYRGELAVFPAPFVPDAGARTLAVPALDSPPVAGCYYLAEQGLVTAFGPSCATMQGVLAMLTGLDPPSAVPWLDAAGCVDARRIRELGAGERGPVACLVQRIVRELFPIGRPWLSSLPFKDGNLAVRPDPSSGAGHLNGDILQALNAIGGIAAINRYLDWQDAYIEKHFPLGKAAPISALPIDGAAGAPPSL